MGSFYTSHTLRGPSQAEVLAFLKGRVAYVSRDERGFVTVLDEECESQDGAVLSRVGAQLSTHFRCPVFAVLNHDDDILYFELFEDGKKTDEYNSSPSYFDDGDDDDFADDQANDDQPKGGNAQRLATVFGTADASKIEAVLRKGDYVFASERHGDLVAALSLPSHSVGVGFTYAAAGDWSPEAASAGYVRTEG